MGEILTNSKDDFLEDNPNTQKDVQFGCNQVIIVKNKATKERVESLYGHALCLTVIEAKGLEFDDVILFDFFNDSINNEIWKKLVNFIDIEETIITEEQSELSDVLLRNTVISKKMESEEPKFMITTMKKNSSFEESDNKKDISNTKTYNYYDYWDWCNGNYYKNLLKNDYNCYKREMEKVREQEFRQYFEEAAFDDLCNEIKLFYVAITRAKKRLFIVDHKLTNQQEDKTKK